MVASIVTTLLFADGGWDHMSGWVGGWMVIGWLAMIAVIALVALAIWRASTAVPGRGVSRVQQILAERFARGEISKAEYDEARSAIDQ